MPNVHVKTYPVSGMSCASCALNVEKTLKRQPGVVSASVNYVNGTALIELNTIQTDENKLQSAVRSIGYDLILESEKQKADENHGYRRIRTNMIWSLLFAMPVMIISMFFMNMPFSNLIMLVLTLPIVTWFGRSFFMNAYKLAKHGQANMDTLVALSTGIAFLFSLFNTFFPQFWYSRGLHPHVYYEASSVVIAFILIGKVLEERAKSKTSSAIKKLMGLQPEFATRFDNECNEFRIPVSDIKHNDRLRVRPGDKIPVDGEITAGSSSVDESTITGESMPVDKFAGEKVFAGTLNLNGSFILKARQIGSETVLSRIIKMVEQAQGSKAPVQKTVDKVAGIFVPVVMVISVLSFIVWMIFGGDNAITHALLAMVTVLVIACPCALGLATPTAIMVGMGKGAKNGILIKDAESLEAIHKINTIILDKTGTITEGKPKVTDIIWLVNAELQQKYEKVLVAIEKQSAHPLAEAIVSAFPKNLNGQINFEEFENISGKGIKATYAGDTYQAGNLMMINKAGSPVNTDNLSKIEILQEQAKTVVLFIKNNEILAIIGLADTIKPNSPKAIGQIKQNGIEVYMLTGDNMETAKNIAFQAGIKNYRANMLPSDKADFIKELQTQGKIVAMAGDGINDSQALAQADVSIAMGRGSDIAMDVAGMTIISSDLNQIPKAIQLSRLTVRTIRQNLFWAFIYNLIGIPIAAGILFPLWGFMLNPMIAAAAMALSSVSVVSNSLRLRMTDIG